jgi:Uncharacterized protein conserved in bacteria (DUF2188)
LRESGRRPPCETMSKQEHNTPVYVVYPAALFDGWEVVQERDDAPVFFPTRAEAIAYAEARAAMDGVALVKVENWFGDTESVWEVRVPHHRAAPTQRVDRGASRQSVSPLADAGAHLNDDRATDRRRHRCQ